MDADDRRALHGLHCPHLHSAGLRVVRRDHRGTESGWFDSRKSLIQITQEQVVSGQLSVTTPDALGATGEARTRFAILSCMDAVTFTRQLIDIESISGNEAAVGNYLYGELCRVGYQTRRCPSR